MRLHCDEHGAGPEVCLLVHGMMGSAESWWRIIPELVEAGYRVLALDLPGHGRSDRDQSLTVERAADSLIETVSQLSPQPPAVAIGHSFGGAVLAAAASDLRPELAVYIDAPFAGRGGHDFAEVAEEYEHDRKQRTVRKLRESRPHYSERDCEVEATAADRFDPFTAAAVASAGGGAWAPMPGSIVIRADPRNYVSDSEADALRQRGVTVRSIPGAAHSIWFSHFDEFIAALPEVFQ
jgi:pimeloyl-ACP methyl ester carboxylesterase